MEPSACQWVIAVLCLVFVLLAIHVKRRDSHTWKARVPQFKVWINVLGKESLRLQAPERDELQGAAGRLWGIRLTLWSQNGYSAIELFFFFFLLNTASTCKSFRLWSLDKLEFRGNKWLEWLKRMLSKCVSSVRSQMRWGRGGAHFVSLDTLFWADFILPLIHSQHYPTLSLDCSLSFESLTGSYPSSSWVLLSF